jgi:hypothetical protein
MLVTVLPRCFRGQGQHKLIHMFGAIFCVFFHVRLYFLLFSARHCCHLLAYKVADKIQGSLHSTEYYAEDGIKSGGGGGLGQNFSGTKVFFRGFFPQNPKRMNHLNKTCCQQKRHVNAFVCLRYEVFFLQKSCASPEDASLWGNTSCMLTNIQKC